MAFSCQKFFAHLCAFNHISYYKKSLLKFLKTFKGPPFYGLYWHGFETFINYQFLNLQNFLRTVF